MTLSSVYRLTSLTGDLHRALKDHGSPLVHTGQMTTVYYWARPREPITELTEGPILMYCPHCHFIPHTPHLYRGSRYGDMGGFTCGQCGGEVRVRDQDCRPPITYTFKSDGLSAGSNGPTETIVYEALYQVQWANLEQIEAWTGHTILAKTGSGTFELEPVVEMLADHVRQQGLEVRKAPIEHPFITWIPEPFRQWLDLIHSLRVHHLDGP
ncbi:hypothetical protein GCM10008949_50680 [Deinococcus humi]|nr:hypothetical protein GCM10008949_50680 [Deinococcus humi]